MNTANANQFQGKAIAIHGNDIDTDRVIPARFLKALTFAALGDYPFYDERFDKHGNALDHPFNRDASQGATLLFANTNFGCGSSREHAPQALHRWGINALVAVSYGEIFAGNCERLGVPATTASKDDIEKLQALADSAPETAWMLDLDAMTVSGGGLVVAISLPEGRRQSLLHGYWNTTDALVANIDKSREVHQRLPYTRNYE